MPDAANALSSPNEWPAMIRSSSWKRLLSNCQLQSDVNNVAGCVYSVCESRSSGPLSTNSDIL